ncbi:2-oxoacid:ferredoxin oxidoreductase subunit beta [Deferribacterales bacterium RsTz2092]|nr:2-oxoglutarate ferredoxin oxidoreductase subunit beta [Deferribacterales bacterium]
MFDYSSYLRKGKLPHIWCPGCGHGIIMKGLIRAIDAMGWSKDETAIASGIGCASRLPGYVDFNTVHTTHGRSIAFATGIKLANPKLNVVVLGGDGDMTAIGGNHLIHACRRNIDMTLIIMNNNIYGMTGGQYSPTTPNGMGATTAPYGMIENNFDVAELVAGAGATFVARGTTYHAMQMTDIIKQAFKHKGFSVVEVIAGCPTNFGRKNKRAEGYSMLEWQRDTAVPLERWQTMGADERADKYPIGILHKQEREDYLTTYDRMAGFKAI